MVKKRNKSGKSEPKSKNKTGRGILNSAINHLPVEMHIPGYQFCGPGTKLKKRMKAGQKGINGLDQACKMHDIAYDTTKDIKKRNIADKLLTKRAMARVRSTDSSFGERVAALTVAGLTKVKSALGAGLHKDMKINKKKKKKNRKKKITTKKKIGTFLRNAISTAKTVLNEEKPKTMANAVRVAIKAAKSSIDKQPTATPSNVQRIIPVPKTGGILPLIPIFAGLSALGALTGGSAAVANAVISANAARKRLKEVERHNETMEAIALGKNKRGDGVYLKPYKKGLGLYTHKKESTKNC